jgi:hypothetical protein
VSIAAEVPIRHLISSSGARDDRCVDYLQLRGARIQTGSATTMELAAEAF